MPKSIKRSRSQEADDDRRVRSRRIRRQTDLCINLVQMVGTLTIMALMISATLVFVGVW